MLRNKFLFLILVVLLVLGGCGKKGPVRPVGSTLSPQTQPTNDCSNEGQGG